MKDLLFFIVKKLTNQDNFEVEEVTDGDRVSLDIKAEPSIIGMIIGKEGKTIKNIRKVMLVAATLQNKLLNITVNEKV